MDQAAFLRQAMAQIKATRNELSARLAISRRRLDTYLLPPASSERRPLPDDLRVNVERLVRDEARVLTPRFDAEPARRFVTSSVRCPENGVVFPTVYRVTGDEYDLKALESGEERRGRRAETRYSLSDETGKKHPAGLYRAVFTPIKWLDPKLDSGWLIIRHHPSASVAEGYVHAVFDLIDDEMPLTPTLYKSDTHIFTLLHRPARPGTPDHLMVYQTEYTRPHRLFGPNFTETWDHIVGPRNKIYPDDVLFNEQASNAISPKQRHRK